MDLWPIHEVVLVDDQLELKVPLLVIDDDELSFTLQNGMVLDGGQIDELIQKVCSQEWHSAIGVTDAFGVVRDHLVGMMQRQVGEGDDMEARRVGRIIAIASLFDSGVDYLRRHWSLIFERADDYQERNVDRDAVDAGTKDRRSVADIVKGVTNVLGPDLKIISRGVEKTVKSSEVAALHAMLILDLKQASKLLNISDTMLRNNGLLNDLGKRKFHRSKLNGKRKGAGIRAQWQFAKEEVQRFGSSCPGSGSQGIKP